MAQTAPAIFSERESNVRSYSRSFPILISRATGSLIFSDTGERYIDFLSGAGALNYGHNNPYIRERILSYIKADGITHALDLFTEAKREFLETFCRLILDPRGLDYKMQFCGPTGTNAVEAALKLARKAKKRTNVISFMGSYHGVSVGSLSASGGLSDRAAAGVPLSNTTFMPYPHGFMASFDTIRYMDAVLQDSYSGVEPPAAVLVETIQAEGGVVVAPTEWLRALRDLCDRHDMLMICDDIQVGCGRTGPFFSFERAGIVPDMVTLSKSIGGFGLPMSLLLMRPDVDVWKPGEHTGTFRGNQLAFVGAKAALEYREEVDLESQVCEKGTLVRDFLKDNIAPLDGRIDVRGLGFIWGIDLSGLENADLAARVSARCLERGLIIECVGRGGAVLKVIPPLTIEPELLLEGCSIIAQSLRDCLGS